VGKLHNMVSLGEGLQWLSAFYHVFDQLLTHANCLSLYMNCVNLWVINFRHVMWLKNFWTGKTVICIIKYVLLL